MGYLPEWYQDTRDANFLSVVDKHKFRAINAGLEQIFTDEADFSGMLDNPERLAVSQVVQKAFIEVGEEGTEAAAASGVIFETYSLVLPHTFEADHPL
ncbi:unnamed protein product [Acanthoscelides obtectus]|uniref:Serpin domain-containing protein n=1 Tax=Acanthoscelides obtectus TaxID=200917 RepID=A0A9P0QHZ8_ACAOB|nr:unnamed protein product [Acanthoscelides obtectus]CAK1683856.1 Heterochromatin-associated protein MENT [Acanthoscelides obtectus]